ncbi:MAG: helix-turn-helix domain-containing protein [Deltaproteobacteria bacterium]|nr:helix-turn-helix domain-containing protein [Deltaproteobacteria bacterium]
MSRPTLRRWRRRYIESGIVGLESRSRPHKSLNKKVIIKAEPFIKC